MNIKTEGQSGYMQNRQECYKHKLERIRASKEYSAVSKKNKEIVLEFIQFKEAQSRALCQAKGAGCPEREAGVETLETQVFNY